MHIASVGIDLGKNTFHLVALGERSKILLRKKFSRAQLLAYTLVIAKPRAAMAVVLVFALIAGENLGELLDNQHLHASALIFTAIWVLFALWWSYFVVQALRKLRERQSQPSTVNE